VSHLGLLGLSHLGLVGGLGGLGRFGSLGLVGGLGLGLLGGLRGLGRLVLSGLGGVGGLLLGLGLQGGLLNRLALLGTRFLSLGFLGLGDLGLILRTTLGLLGLGSLGRLSGLGRLGDVSSGRDSNLANTINVVLGVSSSSTSNIFRISRGQAVNKPATLTQPHGDVITRSGSIIVVMADDELGKTLAFGISRLGRRPRIRILSGFGILFGIIAGCVARDASQAGVGFQGGGALGSTLCVDCCDKIITTDGRCLQFREATNCPDCYKQYRQEEFHYKIQ